MIAVVVFCLCYSCDENPHIRSVCCGFHPCESLAKTLPLQSLVCSWVGIAERGVLSALLLMNKCSHTVFKIQNSKLTSLREIASAFPPDTHLRSTLLRGNLPFIIHHRWYALSTFYFLLFTFYSGLLYI